VVSFVGAPPSGPSRAPVSIISRRVYFKGRFRFLKGMTRLHALDNLEAR
jgi:hypothetical protein